MRTSAAKAFDRLEGVAGRLLPYVFAVVTGFRLTLFLVAPKYAGGDARLYADAARTWLEGGDPWTTSFGGVYYASTPPTLLLFAPFAYLDRTLVTVIWMVGMVVLAGVALRQLRMPLWWLAFPPLSDAIGIGNPDGLVFAMLVIGSGGLAWISVLAKVYAIVPALALGVRAVSLSIAALVLTAPVLPWLTFVNDLPVAMGTLAAQSQGVSAWGTPLLPVAVLSVAVLWRRAPWLAVPTLWPHTQPHYASSSIPGLTPVIALCWAIPNPVFLVAGVGMTALASLLQRHGPNNESLARLRPSV